MKKHVAVNTRRLNTRKRDFLPAFEQLLTLQENVRNEIDTAVDQILQQVRSQGDKALITLTRRFDRWDVRTAKALQISTRDLQQSLARIAKTERKSLEDAIKRVRRFHLLQVQKSWSTVDEYGNRFGQRILPLERVGLYVPGGQAAYPSSVVMNAVPALVAGVKELIMVVPTPQGQRNNLVLAAAYLTGVHRVFAIGGAQAVAALTFGTATIPPVDKIVGPGNAYVATAKRKVFGRIGIDMVAGPSEVLIIADGSGPPAWAALDLMAQAEHDAQAQAVLMSPSLEYLDAVERALQELIPQQPRYKLIVASLKNRGALIHTRSLEEACDLANRMAPEHLQLALEKPERLLPHLSNAGAIFLGHYASEALGDYCAGPNHILPTGGSARFSSPLGVYDFYKRTSILQISLTGARHLSPIAATLAQAEGLQAHADSATARLAHKKKPA